MAMYNLIEYSGNYLKTSGSLWQYYKDESALNNAGNIIDFPNDNNSASFKFKQGQNSTKDIQIMVPLKYVSNFWRTPEMPLIKCETSLYLTCSTNCFHHG